MKRQFRIAQALEAADEIFSKPPALPRLVRPVITGIRMARFALPLDALKPQNRTNHRQPWAYGRDRDRVATLMGLQCSPQQKPLAGRPTVVCTRFSSVEPDKYSDWAKMAIDVLCMPNARAPRRLGLIRDDRPTDAEIVQRWEPAKAGSGMVLIEVFADVAMGERKGAA